MSHPRSGWSSPKAGLFYTVVISILLAACRDDQTAPLGPTIEPRLATNPATAGIDVEEILTAAPRFEIDVDVQGSMKPGHPLHISVHGRALHATSVAEVRLILPEIAAAEQSSWDVVKLPIGGQTRPHIRKRQGLAAGAGFREHTTITIPEPGYYYLAASISQRSFDLETDPAYPVSDAEAVQLWLWIDEHGGRVTEEFDPTLIPEGMRKEAGPVESAKKRSRLEPVIQCSVYPSDGGGIIQSTCTGPNPPPPPPPPPPGSVQQPAIAVKYNDPHSGAQPVGYASYSRVIKDAAGNTVSGGTASGTTDASGVIPGFDCLGSTNSVEITVRTENSKVYLINQSTGDNTTLLEKRTAQCGLAPAVLDVPGRQSHLFQNLIKTYDRHVSVFVHTPTRIRASLHPTESGYYFESNNDPGFIRLLDDDDMIYREWGRFAAAHEYGHLYQDKYLKGHADNGLTRYYRDCERDHPQGDASSLPCAMAEGFATWYAIANRWDDVPQERQRAEDNHYHLTCASTRCSNDGSIVEGAVTAFLFDLVDNNLRSETHDIMALRATQVADQFSWCRVQLGGDWKPHTGIDHIIYCAEARPPYTVTVNGVATRFFNTRTTLPADAWGSGFTGYNDVRRLWLVNLYSKRAGMDPSFSSSAEEGGDPTDPTDPTCGSMILC